MYPDGDIPERIQNSWNGEHPRPRTQSMHLPIVELITIHILKIDLTSIPLREFERIEGPWRRGSPYVANMMLMMRLGERKLVLELRWKDRILDAAEVNCRV
jgi:hypothetical protein